MCGLGKIQKSNFYANKKSENAVPNFFLQPIQGFSAHLYGARDLLVDNCSFPGSFEIMETVRGYQNDFSRKY